MKDFAQKYLNLLTDQLKGINLTRILNFDDFYSKQIIDSIKPLEISSMFLEYFEKTKLLVDVGFGGGFPLLPLAFKEPAKKFIGIEIRNKKVKAVEQIIDELKIKNVILKHIELNDLLIDVPSIITFKAVGKMEELLQSINNSAEALCLFYKGPNTEKNENIPHGEKALLLEKLSYQLPTNEGRELWIYKIVPRGTKNKNKKIVKLSTIIEQF